MPSSFSRSNRSDVLQLVNKIFLPKDQSPWEKFTPDLLRDLKVKPTVHPSTLMYWQQDTATLALLLERKPSPHPDRYVGSFAVGRGLLEWLSIQDTKGKMAMALIVTCEEEKSDGCLSYGRASEVAADLLGKIEPWSSDKADDVFYWLDENLHPRQYRRARRPFRMLKNLPSVLRDEDDE